MVGMNARLDELTAEALARIEAATDESALREVEQTALARKGELLGLMRGIKDLPPEERSPFGQAVNAARGRIEQALTERRETFTAERLASAETDSRFDLNVTGTVEVNGDLTVTTSTAAP